MVVTPFNLPYRKNPCYMQTSWLYVFTELQSLPIKVLHCGNRDFQPFFAPVSDLDLDPITFIYKLDPYSLEIYQMYKYELTTSRLSKVIVQQTDKETDATEIIYHAAS